MDHQQIDHRRAVAHEVMAMRRGSTAGVCSGRALQGDFKPAQMRALATFVGKSVDISPMATDDGTLQGERDWNRCQLRGRYPRVSYQAVN
jgi:hypothetical protein